MNENNLSHLGREKVLKNPKIAYAFLVTFSFLVFGTIGFRIIEGYPLLDALYMTVITLSTVGFGEIHTLSGAGRLFTIFLILFGFGSIAFLAHSFTEVIIERASSQNFGRKKMLKKVSHLSGHHIISGFGRVGESAAERLKASGTDFVVIEMNGEQIKKISELGYNYIEGDATREEVLMEAGIKRANSLLALLNSDPENLFVVLTARELNPTLHIVARTEVASSEIRMLRAGADSIISLYASAGRRVADKIMELNSSNGRKVAQDTPEQERHKWLTVDEDSKLDTHVVETANSFLGGTIVGIRRDGQDILMPDLKEQIIFGDELLVSMTVADQTDKKNKSTYHHRKIVLIDDNPVIRRLYTRLFQKAGFNILTAETGMEGFKLVTRENPDAAVIDYHLPDINGLRVSEKIRGKKDLSGVKIFMFTGEEESSVVEEARSIGVDTVVQKSPEATEIISIVKNELEK